MIKKLLLIFLLLIPIAFADLSDWPAPFVVNHNTAGFADVMGANYVGKHSIVAAEIIYSLRPIEGNFITRLDTEILTTYQNYDLLLIGDPCQNQITAKVLKTAECGLGLKPGEAIIKLVDNGAHKALIVAGYDFESLRKAGLVVAHYQNYDFTGNEYKLEAEQSSSPSPTTVECTTNEECIRKYGQGSICDRALANYGVCKQASVDITCDSGCLVAQSCLNKGEIVLGKYCDGSQMSEFKAKGQPCNENYECITKYCNTTCSNKGILSSIIEWIKNLFK